MTEKKEKPKKVKKPRVIKGDLLSYAHKLEAARKQGIENNRGGR